MEQGLAGNVIDLSSYRSRVAASKSAGTLPGSRLKLGALCSYSGEQFTVVGTWSFSRSPGGPTRRVAMGNDPAREEAAHGYLLVPTAGGEVSFVPFGAVSLGDLVAIS